MKMRKRLTSAARCAIKMRSQESDQSEDANATFSMALYTALAIMTSVAPISAPQLEIVGTRSTPLRTFL